MSPGLSAVAFALLAGVGTYLLYTAVVLEWRGLRAPGITDRPGGQGRPQMQEVLAQAGLDGVAVREFAAASLLLAIVGAAIGWAVFGGVIAATAMGAGAAWAPVAAAAGRRQRRREEAREAWPRLLEEVRLQVVGLGRSIPQALFTVGERGPDELRPAFDAARREWLLSTDFERTLAVLRDGLADPTADAVCETLLIAHEIGGSDVDRRLRALVEDRSLDLEGRKDARAAQAAARFARGFVLVVPLGMALVGLSIGSGRAAYATGLGQVGVLVAFVLLTLCWVWASRLLRLPAEERVFVGGTGAPRGDFVAPAGAGDGRGGRR